jgi:hypothetical protein
MRKVILMAALMTLGLVAGSAECGQSAQKDSIALKSDIRRPAHAVTVGEQKTAFVVKPAVRRIGHADTLGEQKMAFSTLGRRPS